MYEIRKIAEKHRIMIKFGLYHDHDRELFMEELQHAALSVRSDAKHFDMLADFTESMVMPQPIAKDSETLTGWLLRNGMRRSANVTKSITQRMQISRVTDRDERFEYFEDISQAEAWLDQ